MTAITSPGADAALGWEQQIRHLERRAMDAFLAADIATLDELWADDYSVNSPLNRINPKAQVLGLLKSGVIRHTSCAVEIEQMTRHGDVVVVMGRDAVVDPPDGARSERRFTNVWQLQDGRWRSIARQANLIVRPPDQAP
jgi:ketosteroid isomerase-like protein